MAKGKNLQNSDQHFLKLLTDIPPIIKPDSAKKPYALHICVTRQRRRKEVNFSKINFQQRISTSMDFADLANRTRAVLPRNLKMCLIEGYILLKVWLFPQVKSGFSLRGCIV
jgi:hypothetical protein